MLLSLEGYWTRSQKRDVRTASCYLCWPASKHARQDQPRSQDLQVGVQKLIQAWYQRTCAVPGIWTYLDPARRHCSSQNQWVSGFSLTDHWFRPSVRYPHFFLRYPLVIQHSSWKSPFIELIRPFLQWCFSIENLPEGIHFWVIDIHRYPSSPHHVVCSTAVVSLVQPDWSQFRGSAPFAALARTASAIAPRMKGFCINYGMVQIFDRCKKTALTWCESSFSIFVPYSENVLHPFMTIQNRDDDKTLKFCCWEPTPQGPQGPQTKGPGPHRRRPTRRPVFPGKNWPRRCLLWWFFGLYGIGFLEVLLSTWTSWTNKMEVV